MLQALLWWNDRNHVFLLTAARTGRTRLLACAFTLETPECCTSEQPPRLGSKRAAGGDRSSTKANLASFNYHGACVQMQSIGADNLNGLVGRVPDADDLPIPQTLPIKNRRSRTSHRNDPPAR